MCTKPCVVLIALVVCATTTVPLAAASHADIAGIWSLNRDKSAPPGGTPSYDPADRGDGGFNRRRGGGGGGGGFGGGGFGGRGGRGRGGQQGDGQQPDRERMQAMGDYVRRLFEATPMLTVVVHDTSVSFTDAEGRVQTLDTTDKKSDERAENGYVKLTRKTHWDGNALVSEIDVENGPNIERRYESSEGGSEFRVSTTMSGGRGGKRTITQVYERPL
jgi:hypothetical protein